MIEIQSLNIISKPLLINAIKSFSDLFFSFFNFFEEFFNL